MTDLVTVTDAHERRDDVVFLDVREQLEWDAGHIEGAVHVPMGQLRDRLDEVPADRAVVAVCRSGNRSGVVTQALRGVGYDVVNMAGGMQAWAAAGLPFSATDGSPPRVA